MVYKSTKWFKLFSPWMKSYDVTIQMKATEQYFPVVLFIMLYKVVLTFESVDEILWCYHSNESYWAILTCGTVYSVFIHGSSTFQFPRERYCLGLSYGFVKYFDKSWILYPTTKTFSYSCKATASFSTPVGFRHILVWPWDPGSDLNDQPLERDVALELQYGLRYHV